MTRCLHWTDFVLNVLYLVSLIPHFSWTASVRKPRGNVNPQDGCMMAGIDLLRGTKELRKLRATFDLDSKKAYYRVKFCKHAAMCFATTIDQTNVNDVNVVNNLDLWAKIIRTIQGKGHFMPYVKEAHSDQYGGPRDYYNCTNQSGIADRYYIITTKPTKKEIEDLSKGNTSKGCLSERFCTKTCLHKTEQRLRCHEVRLVCTFNCSSRKKRTQKRRLRKSKQKEG